MLLAAGADAPRCTGYAVLNLPGRGERIVTMQTDLQVTHRLQRLSTQDLQILKLENGSVSGHTCKVIVLEPAAGRPRPTVQDLRATISARLGRAPRLRQRLVATPLHAANPAWIDDQGFDIARHVTAVPTEGAVDWPALEQIIARLQTQHLDRTRPLWQLDVVEQLADGAVALIWRLHHCMADGAACMRIGAEVLWSENADPHLNAPAAWVPGPSPSPLRLLALGLRDRAQGAIHAPSRAHPLRAVGELISLRPALRRELTRTATVTPLAHAVGARRKVAFAQARLDDCRRAGKAIDPKVTVNDVVLALVAGGVRTWLGRGLGPAQGIRVKVPVSLHRDAERELVGNRDSYFFVDLPVAEADPVKRLLAINRETRERKLGHDAEALYHLGLHPFVAHWTMSPRVFTFNVSNVRGPSVDVFVAGARVRDFFSLGEIAPEHALRIAVASFSGKLSFGLLADSEAVEDLHVLADGIRAATDELLGVARRQDPAPARREDPAGAR